MCAHKDRFAAWWLHLCTIIMEVCEIWFLTCVRERWSRFSCPSVITRAAFVYMFYLFPHFMATSCFIFLFLTHVSLRRITSSFLTITSNEKLVFFLFILISSIPLLNVWLFYPPTPILFMLWPCGCWCGIFILFFKILEFIVIFRFVFFFRLLTQSWLLKLFFCRTTNLRVRCSPPSSWFYGLWGPDWLDYLCIWWKSFLLLKWKPNNFILFAFLSSKNVFPFLYFKWISWIASALYLSYVFSKMFMWDKAIFGSFYTIKSKGSCTLFHFWKM